jgi:hypothetical protein
MVEVLLDPANVIGTGGDVLTLQELIVFALREKTEPCISYSKPVPGTDRSIRLFGKGTFEGCSSYPKPLSAQELALQLVHFSDARYPRAPSAIAKKGWTISRCAEIVDDSGSPLIVAYATWIED